MLSRHRGSKDFLGERFLRESKGTTLDLIKPLVWKVSKSTLFTQICFTLGGVLGGISLFLCLVLDLFPFLIFKI